MLLIAKKLYFSLLNQNTYMKKMMFTLFIAFCTMLSFAQTTADKMKKHSGETLEVKVVKVGETTITCKYPGEDAEQTIGKFSVATIT